MQLNISEFRSFNEVKQDEDTYDKSFNNYNNVPNQSSIGYEKIPENIVPIKVIKKGVHFEEPIKPIHQAIPRVNAKMIRPQIPSQIPKISYEEILSKMGMFVSDGKLHLVDRNTLTPQQHKELLDTQQQQQQHIETNIPQNSYIYNKFFKDDLQAQNNIRQPRTLEEYKMMLIEEHIQRQRIKQMKSTKLIMPTSNINISEGNSVKLNKLFSFSKR